MNRHSRVHIPGLQQLLGMDQTLLVSPSRLRASHQPTDAAVTQHTGAGGPAEGRDVAALSLKKLEKNL